jgi:hypothetical protein
MERRTKKVGAIEASWGKTRQPLGVVVGVAFLDILNKSSRRFQDQIKFSLLGRKTSQMFHSLWNRQRGAVLFCSKEAEVNGTNARTATWKVTESA